MTSWSALFPYLVLGLLGSAHCVGMCGGFALAAAAPGEGVLARQLGYALGKALTYAVLALALAVVGELVVRALPPDAAGVARRILLALAALFLLALGAKELGLPLPAVRPRPARALVQAGTRAVAGLRALPPWAHGTGLGLVNGLVPCGLSWGAIVLASQAAPATALLGALTFGLATAPALLALGLLPRFAPRLLAPERRRVVTRVAGVLLLVWGGRFLVASLAPARPHGAAACCAPERAP